MEKHSLIDFSKTLAGQYSNFKQAQADPKDFAHINIYFQPLEWCFFNSPGFYSEQSYDYSPWSPYRQAVHKLVLENNIYIMKNYKLNDPIRFAGSGFMPDLLKTLKNENIESRNGCSMHFKEIKPGTYKGKVEPGKKCLINRAGKISYLKSKVLFNKKVWLSLDLGLNISNDNIEWGSENGPLIFNKIKTLSKEIDTKWITNNYKNIYY